MLCSLILYSLNNIIQYYTLFFLELRNTYNILSARSTVKKSSIENDCQLMFKNEYNIENTKVSIISKSAHNM